MELGVDFGRALHRPAAPDAKTLLIINVRKRGDSRLINTNDAL
jgi:hypothetical protein